MAKEEAKVENPNEIVFSKTKGVGSINYGSVTTTAAFGETSLSVERIGKVLFFKGKPKQDVVEYAEIAGAEVKTHFSKGDLISGIILGVLAIIFAATGAFGEEGPGILVGPVIIAVMVFCSYGKNIVVSRKNGSTVTLLSEGFGQKEGLEQFSKKLKEHGVSAIKF
jgi:hypothetical protein